MSEVAMVGVEQAVQQAGKTGGIYPFEDSSSRPIRRTLERLLTYSIAQTASLHRLTSAKRSSVHRYCSGDRLPIRRSAARQRMESSIPANERQQTIGEFYPSCRGNPIFSLSHEQRRPSPEPWPQWKTRQSTICVMMHRPRVLIFASQRTSLFPHPARDDAVTYENTLRRCRGLRSIGFEIACCSF